LHNLVLVFEMRTHCF